VSDANAVARGCSRDDAAIRRIRIRRARNRVERFAFLHDVQKPA
jgi:hypothetical protein